MSIGNEFQADGAETAKALSVCPGMPKISYPDRLRKLKLPTLTYRRARGKGAGSYLAGMAVAIPILNVDGRRHTNNFSKNI